MGSTHVSAPGKLILMGEHAVVYGRPALVTAVDLRLRVTLEDAPGDSVRLRLPEVGVDETTPWAEILRYTRIARERWESFAKEPSPERFRLVRGEDPAHLVKVALGEAAEERGAEAEGGLELSAESQIPIGSGFGSSAAAAVAVVAGYRQLRGADEDSLALDRSVLAVERRQHGLPSGVDHATSIAGGVLWAHRNEAGTMVVRSLSLAEGPLSRLRVYDSGAPAESTGEVVAAVRDRVQKDPSRYQRIFDRMERCTLAFREQLAVEHEDPTVMVEILREYEARLESLGVVPEPVREILRRIEASGGAAKVSGAGALTGSAAGGVLVYHPSPDVLAGLTAGLTAHDVRLGAAGLRWEIAA